MGSYAYEAIDSAGKIVKGTVEAENEEGVKAELKRQSITCPYSADSSWQCSEQVYP